MIVSRIIGLVIGYVFGLFPSGTIVGKLHHTNLKQEGSGNTGMTNSIRVLGWKAGMAVLAGDLLKAILSMAIVWFIFHKTYPDAAKLFELYAGLGAVLGHNYPFYAKFKGGKGVACSIGIVFAMDWRMAPFCALLFFLVVIPTGFMSIGSLCILSGYMIQVIVFGQLGWLHLGQQFLAEFYIISAVITALSYVQHRENIKRLISGTENKFVPSKNKK